eukprot:TRINITY_DN2057_c0_g1_i1.p1 TRINITY_DN2057_c0_g1~~TRINITY_DN2057_c0_g1_i1.p1  ORF type:complete len:254 (+),score=35.51 TRINITY_DN2057_c0_g1_i1:80-841(+)
MAHLLRSGVVLSAAVGLSYGSGTSKCASHGTCADCLAGGCGWCSFVLGQGSCLGLDDGNFSCPQVYTTVPALTCWNHSTQGGQSGPGGGYYCDAASSRCMPMFEGPTPAPYTSLTACINDCRPQEAKGPFWLCNATSGRCEEASAEAGGTTKDRCEDDCWERRLCSGGACVSQGVNGAGSKSCNPTGSSCPAPEPGINCSALAGCAACTTAASRCGWCPYYKQCFDVAPHAPVFTCPPGFSTDPSGCEAELVV